MKIPMTIGGCRKAALVAAAAMAASTAMASGVGTTGAQFLKVGVGARPLAMAGAFSALADDANALNWNPGALGAQTKRSATLSYNALFDDTNQGFLGYAHPLADEMGTLAGGINYLTVSNIPKRAGDTESPDSTFNNQNFVISGAYGKKTAVEGLSVGGTLKYLRETLDSFSASAVAIDAGALYKTRVPGLTAGGSIQNLGTKLGPDPLPTTLKGGAAYKLLGDKLALAGDLDWFAEDRRAQFDLGAEYWAHKALALRAGYQFGRWQDHLGGINGASFGFGVCVERLRFDYAFLPFGRLGDTHRMTLGWTF